MKCKIILSDKGNYPPFENSKDNSTAKNDQIQFTNITYRTFQNHLELKYLKVKNLGHKFTEQRTIEMSYLILLPDYTGRSKEY